MRAIFSYSCLYLKHAKPVTKFDARKVILQDNVIQRNSSTEATTKPKLRFDGQTAIVTGAGRGLGREYALLLASRGCNVVVNDFGGSVSGEKNPDESVAESLAKELTSKFKSATGARALANCESVADEDGARRLVQSTLQEFGRVDILINNAGILRDVSFGKMTTADFDQVIKVHLRGSYLVTRECWNQMRKQNYGRIIMTSSTSGLYGNFGQAHYAAAKMALVGLTNTLAIEGARNNINCNAIVPVAFSRMTEQILPEELSAKLDPAYIAPIVAWLCHSDCTESGAIFEAAGQWFGKYRLQRSRGRSLEGIANDPNVALETIVENWTDISGFEEGAKHLESFGDHLNELMRAIDPQIDGTRL